MNVASSLRRIYSSPLGSFLPLPNPRGYLDAPDLAHCDDGPPVPNLGSVTECGWRLEGSTHFGTQLYAVPVALLPNLPPIHVDVIIPDQTQWSPELWAKLDASRSSHMTDGRFNQLGIAKHVLRVLGHWSSSIFDFQEQYLALPFSSSIIIGEIIPNIEDTPVRFSGAKHHSHLLTPAELQKLWEPLGLKLPRAVDLNEMRYLERKAPGIALVQITGSESDGPYILKAKGGDPDALYHELKQLLRLPPHRNLVAHSLFVATIKEPGTDVGKVCGFVLKFYPGPNFEIGLKQKNRDGTLLPADQLRWAKDVAKALIHISKSPVKFASDLKMDNIMMTTVDGQETAVLIDFEQGRNTFSWAPTEIYLIEWLAIVATPRAFPQAYATSTPNSSRSIAHREALIFSPWGNPISTIIHLLGGICHGLLVLRRNRKQAMSACLEKSYAGQREARIPDLHQNPPPAIQDLIKRCTEGSREWTEGLLGLTRNGSKIYPRGKSGQDGEETASLDETRVAIQAVWLNEIKKGEAFVEARMRHDKGVATAEDARKLRYLNRPKLTEVLARLEKITL
ncbi:hypothetical protein BKA61DRAFT_723655 [Leptodontidium sp. MPI-SDFR-AT-0119]|nr:hypothetical protein BKA61DRAFT_723655 [Leptodontidium sp. MPI-SDFR-AT-0119]